MKFLADECCDAALVNALRVDGHDVLYVIESLRGATDEEILSRAFSESRILLTEDKDFGELVYRLQLPTYGIVLLRFDVTDRAIKIPRLRDLLEFEAERLSEAFVVLEVDKTRIRPLTWCFFTGAKTIFVDNRNLGPPGPRFRVFVLF